MRVILHRKDCKTLKLEIPEKDILQALVAIEKLQQTRPASENLMVAITGNSGVTALCRPKEVFCVSQYL